MTEEDDHDGFFSCSDHISGGGVSPIMRRLSETASASSMGVFVGAQEDYVSLAALHGTKIWSK